MQVALKKKKTTEERLTSCSTSCRQLRINENGWSETSGHTVFCLSTEISWPYSCTTCEYHHASSGN